MTAPGVHDLVVHGFADIPWDDASLPTGFWAVMERLPNGCWVDRRIDRDAKYRETVATRLLRVLPKDILAIVPTCGTLRCANPAHLCVTMRTVLSSLPLTEVPRA